MRNISLCVCARMCARVHTHAHSVAADSLQPCSPPGSSVHGISQARIAAWVAISFSRGIFSSKGWMSPESLILTGRFFTAEPEAYIYICVCVCVYYISIRQLNTDWVVSMSWLLQSVLIWLGCMDHYKLEFSFFPHMYYIPTSGIVGHMVVLFFIF